MDEHVEDGNAFAVPDLWETSTLAHFEFDQNPTSRLFLNLEPLGMSLALKYALQNFSTDSLQQIQKMTQEYFFGSPKILISTYQIYLLLRTDPSKILARLTHLLYFPLSIRSIFPRR